VVGCAGHVGRRHPPPSRVDGHIGQHALPDITDADQPVESGMGHEDDVGVRGGPDRGKRPGAVRRQEVGHRGCPFGQIGMALPAQALDAPVPTLRRPVPPFGEDKESAALVQAGRQPPDLLGPLPAGSPGAGAGAGPVRVAPEERVGQPVGHDVHARVQLQCGLHDDPGTSPAVREQVVDEQERIAGARVPAEHDDGTVIEQARVRRRGHLDAQPAGAARRPVGEVEVPPHDRVVTRPVGLGVKPAAEPARDPQAEQSR
jgi:hypothetical protein